MQSRNEETLELIFKKRRMIYQRDYRLTALGVIGMSFDFYLPHKKLFIELNGEQHFMVTGGHSPRRVAKLQENDFKKKKFAWSIGHSVVDVNFIGSSTKDFKNKKFVALMDYIDAGKFADWKRI